MTANDALRSTDLVNWLEQVRQRIALAGKRAGRAPTEVRLLPVSKTVSADSLCSAYAAGCHDLGENKMPQLQSRLQHLARLLDAQYLAV